MNGLAVDLEQPGGVGLLRPVRVREAEARAGANSDARAIRAIAAHHAHARDSPAARALRRARAVSARYIDAAPHMRNAHEPTVPSCTRQCRSCTCSCCRGGPSPALME
jgi:hypothetical protein